MAEKLTCPRRMMEYGPWERKENLDSWQNRQALANGIVDLHCSFCGSLHPSVFLSLVEAGAEVTPTDKSYKAYINYEGKETKFYFQHLSQDQILKFIDLLNNGGMKLAFPGRFYTKPFFLVVNSAPPFSFGAIIKVEQRTTEGQIITLIDPFYTYLINEIKKNPEIIYHIDPRKWEEIIAAAYDKAGFDEVILTPRSGDFGRDVIAIKNGIGSVKFIEQVKAIMLVI